MTQTSTLDAELTAEVTAWIRDDPDPQTANELSELLAQAGGQGALSSPRLVASAVDDLRDRFAGPLTFGTAGLRGEVGGGPARMNRAVVIRTTAGLVDFLATTLASEASPARIVIGFDARHRSDEFAVDTAAVAQAAGLDVYLMPRPLPTPVLAYAVRRLDADAGVMVTASHNPPRDNGYKVYLGGRVVRGSGQGAQIVPPADARIAERIAAAPSAASVPRAATGWQSVGEDLIDAYVSDAAAFAGPAGASNRAELRIVHTSLHGVGDVIALRALREAGFTSVHTVAEQAQPDPDFPTVAFPNPEEPGAIDLALDLARTIKADIVIANDPDADRCAMAVRDPLAPPDTGGWRMLHGDEVGALIGDHLARRYAGTDAVFANSVVSSRLLAKIAADHGLRHRTTLTGFKWISRVDGLSYGYEEALGYCVDPAHVRDKDGISAAVLIAHIAATVKASGRSIIEVLDDLALGHGLHLSDQLSVRMPEREQIVAVVAALRATPPTQLGGSPVVEVTDLSAGTPDLPPTDALILRTDDDTRVIVRPSGTEAKLKCYLEIIAPVPADTAVARTRLAARERMVALKKDLAAVLGLS